MTDEANKKGPESTRREFLTATTALAGAALAGLPGPAEAERKRDHEPIRRMGILGAG